MTTAEADRSSSLTRQFPEDGAKGLGGWTRERAIEWCFDSRVTGRLTIIQFPNAALWTFLLATVIHRLSNGNEALGFTSNLIATAALGWWAVDEVLRGVNPWRRLLGVTGLTLVAIRVLTGSDG